MKKKLTFRFSLFLFGSFSSFFFLQQSAQAQWQLMNGPITCFAKKPNNLDIIYAGDAYGLIRISTDKGATWKVAAKLGVGIKDIAFIDASKGFVATDQSGLIFVTVDGGLTWQKKQIVDPAKPKDPYRFKSTSRIIVVDGSTVFFDVYSHPISNPSEAETIVTRDGGLTYEVAYAPGNLYHVAGDTMVAFGRKKDPLFALEYFTVFRSLDKGKSWSTYQYRPAGAGSALNGNGINYAFFFTSKEYLLTVNKSLGSDAQLYKTVDGGITFTTVTKPGSLNAKVEWLHFKDRLNGVAIMNQNGPTFVTNNGGASWTQATKGGGHFPGIYLGNETLLTDFNGRTTTSTTYGTEWTPQSDPLNSVNGGATASLVFLQVVNKDVAYASLGGLVSGSFQGTTLVKTSNGGISWHNVLNASNVAYKGEAYGFLAPDTFLAFQSSGFATMRIVLTKNGGKTFTTQSEDFRLGSLDATPKFRFIDKKNSIAYCKGGTVDLWLSNDTGSTWSHLPTFTSAQIPGVIVDIAAPSLNSWYLLVDQGRKVFRSTNQGTSWNEVTNGISFVCGAGGAGQSLYFVNDTTGYVFGCGGNLFKTTDGAKTWTNLKSTLPALISNNSFTFMDFRTSQEGYLLGSSTNYTAQTNDLTAWNVSASLPTGTRRVDFSDENSGGAVLGTGFYYSFGGPVEFVTDTVQATVLPVGLSEVLLEGKHVSIYPNPTETQFRVMAVDNGLYEISISDLSGREVLRTVAQNKEEIAVSQLRKGLYLVTVRSGDASFCQKLLIK